MGKTRVRIAMDDEQRILLKRSLNKNGEGQKFFTHEVRRLCVPYVPNLTGTLQQTAVEHTTHITYGQPYARRQYYENKSKPRWFETMKASHKEPILKGAERIARE